MISDVDKTNDNYITCTLLPLTKNPATGQEEAIERGSSQLQQELYRHTDCIERVTNIVTVMEQERNEYIPQRRGAIIRSMSNDLTSPGRSHTRQRVGKSILDALGDQNSDSSLADTSEWRELNDPTNHVIVRVTGINNLKTFFVTDKFRNTNYSQKD